MRLFYTISSQEGKSQKDPLLSLGGFRSSSMVPNDTLNAIFGDISEYSIQKRLPEYIGLILQNTFSSLVESISIWIPSVEGRYCKFRLAVVELSPSNEMETISTVNSKPLQAEFYECSEEGKFELEGITLSPGQGIGLWLERTLDPNSEDLQMRNDCLYLYENSGKVDNIESGEIKIEFEYVRS